MNMTFSLAIALLSCILLILPACEKDKDNGTSGDPRLSYRPTLMIWKYNGEYDDKEMFTYESDRLMKWEDFDYEADSWEPAIRLQLSGCKYGDGELIRPGIRSAVKRLPGGLYV